MAWFVKKSVTVPDSNVTREVDAAKLWYVRWRRRYGAFSGDTHEVMEAFPNQDDANHFAESLRAAYKLLRHTSGTEVTVTAKDHAQV